MKSIWCLWRCWNNAFRCLLFSAVVGSTLPAEARVKLVAVPERADLSVSFTHPSHVLVQESRVLTLQEGVNKVDFSWQAVSIRPDSIQIHILEPTKGVTVLNTSYPPGESALVWEVSSDQARESKVRITYLLHRLQKEDFYQGVLARDEKKMEFRRFIRLYNRSGEELSPVDLRWSGGEVRATALADGEILEKLAEAPTHVLVKKKLVWDAQDMPWDAEHLETTPGLPLFYVTSNTAANGLGKAPLPAGKMRVFIETSDSVAFSGESAIDFTPLGSELAINIGKSREVKITQRKMKDERVNLRRNNSNHIVLWDTDEAMTVDIENFKKEPVNLTLVQYIDGYWKMTNTSHPFERKEASILEFDLVLKPESKETLTFSYQRLNVQNEQEAYRRK